MPLEEYTYLCQKCQNLFKPGPDSIPPNEKYLTCPRCSSTQIERSPSWTPAGSNLDTYQLEWDYECQNCHKTFKLPIPASPSQEKGITCPECSSGHIHRLTPTGGEPLYCG